MKLIRLNDIIIDALADRVFTAASYAVAHRGEAVATVAFGHVDDSPGAAKVDGGTLFDVASLTKPVVTATAILKLIDERRLVSSALVSNVLPFPDDAAPDAWDFPIAHLLTHTSGLPATPSDPDTWVASPWDETGVVDAILRTPPAVAPGARYLYSDCGYILLGRIVEMIARDNLAKYAQERIFAPLGMLNSTCLPDPARAIVATSRDLPPGKVHDPRARAMGGVAGHAGLFSTAGDLLRFGEAVRIGNPALLSSDGREGMLHSQISPAIGSHSYGWFCQGAPLFPGSDFFSSSAIAHSGFTGCVLAVDPARELTAVLLTNRVYRGPDDNTRYLAFRRKWLQQLCFDFPPCY